MAAQNPQNRDHWNGYYYNFGEGERCVVTFNVQACYSQNQRPSSGRRLIGFSPEEYVSPQGMPTGPAFERLKAIEARAMALVAQQRVGCWLVGKQVYRGMRELLFQVEDPHLRNFDTICDQIEKEFGGTEVVPYDGWQFFNDKIRPDEDASAHISNRDLIEALKKHGADQSKYHMLDHTFVGPANGLEQVKLELIAAGFRPGGSSDGHIVLSSSASLDQDDIDVVTRRLRDIAKRCSVKYDGWGTMLDQR
jgi:regulator of RNase E activity RraB